MADSHITEDLISRFVRTEVSREEAQQVLRHLLAGCSQCSDKARRAAEDLGILALPAQRGREQSYEMVFQRAFYFTDQQERQLAEERLQGWAQWAAIEPLAPEVRIATVKADWAFHTFGLYDRLLEASRWAMRSEPAEAVDIVQLAILVAEHLDPTKLGRERIADLRAHAWAQLGNTQRIASNFDGARSAFNEAWRILEDEGTNEAIDRASILVLEASYMKDVGEFELAESALQDALEVHRRHGDPHQQGRILLKMGDAIGYIKPEQALIYLKKALSLIDVAREPRLELCALHDFSWFLADTGKPEEALAILERARPLYHQFPDDFTQLRLHWLEGKIAHGLEKYDEAEHIFAQLWEELRVRNLNQEVVLVSIELAQVLTRKGENARAAELAAQCFSIMMNWGLHNDALAAWIVFQDALTQGAAEGNVFEKIEAYYRRHWVRPARFSA